MYYIFYNSFTDNFALFYFNGETDINNRKGKVSIKLILSQIFPFQGLKSLKSWRGMTLLNVELRPFLT